jgi:HAD superfamily phosphatase (TIGR01668 family)
MLDLFASLLTIPFTLFKTIKYQSHRPVLPKQVSHLAAIDLDQLQLGKIKGIILDLDNTVVSEDDRYLSPQAETWIKQGQSQGINFFILSNGKRKHRVIYWSGRLDIPAINPAKKPFPLNFHKAIKQMNLKSTQVLVIGDSFHTDIMGAWLSGCGCIQVATLPHPPRWWEKICGQWLQIPYPPDQELWTIHKLY